MLNFSKVCIISGSDENLNTMTVKIDGTSYQVSLCDEYEETSLKEIKRLVTEKIEEFDKLCMTLGQFGYKAVPIESTVATDKPIAAAAPAAAPAAPQTKSSEKHIDALPDLDTTKVRISGPGNIQKAHSIPDAIVNKDGTSVQKPVMEHQELQIVESESGRPIPVPKKVRDDTGETVVTIINTNNKDLMRRSQIDTQREHSFSQGYAIRDCPLCDGMGQKRGDACPKCSGSGTL